MDRLGLAVEVAAVKRPEYVAAETRFVGLVTDVNLGMKSGQRIVRVKLEVTLPQWVNPTSLVMCQGQLADVLMQAIDLDTAKDLRLDRTSRGEPMNATTPQ